MLSGILFLGTPHKSQDLAVLSERSKQVLRSCMPNIPRRLLSSLEDTSGLRLNATLFEDVNLRVDIISVFELVPTKHGKPSSMWKRRKSSVVRTLSRAEIVN